MIFNPNRCPSLGIRELAETVRKVVGFPGELVFDASISDGTPRKL